MGFDKDTSTWIERGRGQVRLNDLRTQAESGPTVTSRIIMRTAGSLRVILNSKIFPEMTLEKPTEKNIRLTVMDGLDQGMKVFLVSGSTKDVGTLFSALKRRLDTVKKSSTNTSQSAPNKETSKRKLSKRKLSEEQKDTEVKANEEGNDEQ